MTKTVDAVDRALNILDLLAENYEGLRVSEIAAAAEIPYTTARRLVTTLVANGYVQMEPDTGRYMLSLKILRLYRGLHHRINLSQISFPHLTALMKTFEETVHLAVLNEGEVVYLNSIVSPRSLAMYTEVGKRAPVHCTALGKVFLAHMPSEEVLEILQTKGMERRTPHTITEPDKLIQVLDKVRADGYALDDEEVELGLRCISAPIVNHEERVIAAVSLSAPKARLSMRRVPNVAAAVMHACAAISRELGAPERAIAAVMAREVVHGKSPLGR